MDSFNYLSFSSRLGLAIGSDRVQLVALVK